MPDYRIVKTFDHRVVGTFRCWEDMILAMNRLINAGDGELMDYTPQMETWEDFTAQQRADALQEGVELAALRSTETGQAE